VPGRQLFYYVPFGTVGFKDVAQPRNIFPRGIGKLLKLLTNIQNFLFKLSSSINYWNLKTKLYTASLGHSVRLSHCPAKSESGYGHSTSGHSCPLVTYFLGNGNGLVARHVATWSVYVNGLGAGSAAVLLCPLWHSGFQGCCTTKKYFSKGNWKTIKIVDQHTTFSV